MMSPKRLTRELAARLDGPHSAEHTIAAADLASEAIRYLNYATGSHRDAGLEYPADPYSVIASLSRAAWFTPQLLSQLDNWLAAQLAAGLVGVDDGTDPAAPLAKASAQLKIAQAHALNLAEALDGAQTALAYVNGHGPNRAERAA